MIKIIAVHPDVMSTPEGIREYLKDFGTAKGRWIPLVPSNWKSVVSQAIRRHPTLGNVKKNELRDKITNPKYAERFLKIESIDGDSRAWKEIANEFCTRGLFDAAIAPQGHQAADKFLIAGEFDPDCDLYAVRTSGFIVRDPEELARQVTPMLRFAIDLHVIDVYCQSVGSSSASYGRFFEGLLQWSRRNNPELRSINLHRRLPAEFDRERELENYRSWVSRFLQPGEVFHVRYLRERQDGETMHLRAVFTDRLLVTGHYGFGKGKSPTETTDLTLRENADLVTIRNLYLDDVKIGFDLIHQIEITSNTEIQS